MHKEIHWDKDLKNRNKFINYFLYKITVNTDSALLTNPGKFIVSINGIELQKKLNNENKLMFF